MISESARLQSRQNYRQEATETLSYYDSVAKIISFTPGIFSDLLLLPFAGGLLSAAYMGYQFNPTEIKKGIPPIVLLHGSGFNESEFIVARYFLNKDTYGSILSFNMEGLVLPDTDIGVDDHAKGIVREKFQEIARLTECNTIIPIGHSMGGVIAAYYAECFAEEDVLIMEDIFTVASPAQGTPTLDFIWTHISPNFKNGKRHNQMSASGGESYQDFSKELCMKAQESERQKKRRYHCVRSITDWAVPFQSGLYTDDPDRILTYNYVGHYGIIALPSTWNWMTPALDRVYTNYSRVPK